MTIFSFCINISFRSQKTILTAILQSSLGILQNNTKIASLRPSYSTQQSEVTLQVNPYKLHKLDNGPPTSTSLTKDEALEIYENMYTLRRMEVTAGELYKQKKVVGFCHLYVGQEAVATGIHAAMSDVDSVVTAYRCHGWAHLMGVSVVGVLAELTGRLNGCSRGKGGSMHMYAPKFYGGNGIVGAQVPLGAGAALAHKYKGDGGACFTLYGDGAANQGQLHEAFNIAKLWKLPCIFVCENNKYGLGTAASRASACTEYYTRGDYIPGLWVDGMDVLAVREASRFALEHIAQGKGPILIETETYRYYGHSMSDPGTSYRSRDEVKEVRQTRDAIKSFKDKVISNSLMSAEEFKTVEVKVKKLVDAAGKEASTAAVAPPTELTSDVYMVHLDKDIRGTFAGQRLKHHEVYKRATN